MQISLHKTWSLTLLVLLLLLLGKNSCAQELIESGRLAELHYQFKGPEHHKEKSSLTHALSYAYSKDIIDIKSSITYQVNYKVLKIPSKGFETIISLRPPLIKGHTELYEFDFSKEILPVLASFKIFYANGNELIYVKPILNIDTVSSSFYFRFQHQRYAADWQLSLEQTKWRFKYSEKDFQKRWALVNDYQMAYEWIEQIESLEEANSITEKYIQKTRWIKVLEEIQNLEFYQELLVNHQTDPLQLQKKISIRQYTLEREIQDLQQKLPPNYPSSNLQQISNAYIQVEKDLLQFSYHSTNLYGDLYFEFSTKSQKHFCISQMKELFQLIRLENNWENFEYGVQKNSLELIKELMANKRANEALFQVERFNQFYKNAEFLNSSSTFAHFKAKAVYDIYLSYIEVSKQALEHQHIDMAIDYLNKASDIQKQYPMEIINDLKVEKELQTLIKRAMDRYQHLLDEGDYKTAKRVKEGILGLMKKLGIDQEELLLEEG